jgi:hypothetical protein
VAAGAAVSPSSAAAAAAAAASVSKQQLTVTATSTAAATAAALVAQGVTALTYLEQQGLAAGVVNEVLLLPVVQTLARWVSASERRRMLSSNRFHIIYIYK